MFKYLVVCLALTQTIAALPAETNKIGIMPIKKPVIQDPKKPIADPGINNPINTGMFQEFKDVVFAPKGMFYTQVLDELVKSKEECKRLCVKKNGCKWTVYENFEKDGFGACKAFNMPFDAAKLVKRKAVGSSTLIYKVR